MTTRIARWVSALSCAHAIACAGGAPAASDPAPAPATAETAGAEAAAEPAPPAETWWTDDVPEDATEGGLSAVAHLTGRGDGATASLNGTDLFPTRSGITTLFAPDHTIHASIQDADAQWRFSLRPGTNEAVMGVSATTAREWMAAPPMLVVHQEGRRWPSVVLVASRRRETELRASFALGDVAPDARRPVVVTDATDAVVPVLFLRIEHGSVDVALNGEGTEFTAASLRMHVAPLTARVRPGANTMTLEHRLTDEPEEDEEDEEDEEEAEESAAPPPPMLEYLLVVGDRVYPGRAELRPEPQTITVAFDVPAGG